VSDKAETIAALESGYDGFRARFASLPEEAYSEVWLGSWNLDQLLAHMAGWYREMAGAIERVSRGERPAPEGVDYNDPEPWNLKFAAGAKHGKAGLADFDDAFQAYNEAARKLGEDQYGVDSERGRPRIGNRLLEGAGIGHFKEHLPELEHWLASRSQA
jgi:hypothetical protein